MRTMVKLDADVEQLLREEMRRQGKSFKETLNDALRRGLGPSDQESEVRPFAVESRPLRLRPELAQTLPGELDDDLEIAGFLGKTARLHERRGGLP